MDAKVWSSIKEFGLGVFVCFALSFHEVASIRTLWKSCLCPEKPAQNIMLKLMGLGIDGDKTL